MLRIGDSLHRVLIIEGDTESSPALVHAMLANNAALQCDRIAWGAAQFRNVLILHVELIVVVAVAVRHDVSPTFAWLERHATAPVIAIVPDGDEALLRLAAGITDDFLFAPVRPLELRHRVQRLLTGPRHDLEDVRQRLIDEVGFSKLVGKDATFLRAIRPIPRLARTDATVLITGETGT